MKSNCCIEILVLAEEERIFAFLFPVSYPIFKELVLEHEVKIKIRKKVLEVLLQLFEIISCETNDSTPTERRDVSCC